MKLTHEERLRLSQLAKHGYLKGASGEAGKLLASLILRLADEPPNPQATCPHTRNMVHFNPGRDGYYCECGREMYAIPEFCQHKHIEYRRATQRWRCVTCRRYVDPPSTSITCWRD